MRKPRQHYRHSVKSLAYVRLDHGNGGIIRDISESGIAVQAVERLSPGQLVHLRFELFKPRVRVDAGGQVAWANTIGQAGLRFIDLPLRLQQLLKDWILTDLLAAASELTPGRAPIFDPPDESDGLIVSSSAVPVIRISEKKPSAGTAAPELADDPIAEMPLRLSWWPADISPETFARFVDSLVVIAAVLLFSVIAVETAGVFPSWTLAVAVAGAVTCVFGCLYRYLATTLTGMTLGRRLARIAAEDMHWNRRTVEEDAPRFR
ncbi:MAG TPA: PilZ domain-containing protein [Terriglobales bacterium]